MRPDRLRALPVPALLVVHFLSRREVLRRLSLSPSGAKRDLRRSVSSEDLLAGLRIRVSPGFMHCVGWCAVKTKEKIQAGSAYYLCTSTLKPFCATSEPGTSLAVYVGGTSGSVLETG